MTERVNSLTLVLEKDIRVDDVESLVSALKHFRGVIAVKENITEYSDYIAYERARNNLRDGILDVMYPERKNTR